MDHRYIDKCNGYYHLLDEDGNLHSHDDLPAVITPYGEHWFMHGKRHRENGPATIHMGREIYYLNNCTVRKQEEYAFIVNHLDYCIDYDVNFGNPIWYFTDPKIQAEYNLRFL